MDYGQGGSRSRAVVGLAVVAVAGMLVMQWAASPPSGAEAPSQEHHPSDVAWAAERFGISTEEAEHRMTVEDAAGDLQQEAMQRWPDTFAGMWFNEAGPTTLTIAFTDEAEENVDELADDFDHPEVLRAADALHSRAELGAVLDRITVDREELKQGRQRPDLPAQVRETRGRFDLALDQDSNGLVLAAAKVPPGLREAAARHYGVPFETSTAVASPNCTRTDCRYSMRGGLQLGMPGNYVCSSAFTAYGAATGNRFVMSAAHCGNTGGSNCTDVAENDPGGTRTNGGSIYGSVTGERARENMDAERIQRSGNQWSEVPVIWVESNDQRAVHGVLAFNSVVQGMQLGKSGRTTGTTRGLVTRTDSRPCYIAGARQFIETDMCSGGGDSGAAVFRNNYAVAIHSGATTAYNCGHSSFRSIHGHVQFALSALNLTLLTSSSPPPPTTTTTTRCTVVNPLGGCVVP